MLKNFTKSSLVEVFTRTFHGVVIITAAQRHSTKPEFRFAAGLNPARGVPGIRDGEDL